MAGSERPDASPNDEEVEWYVQRVNVPLWMPAGCLFALMGVAFAVLFRWLRRRRGS